MTPYHAIIFDLDGTIVNTMPVWQAATKEFMQEHQLSCSPQEIGQLFSLFSGKDIYTSSKNAIQRFALPYTPDELVKRLSALFHKNFMSHIAFVDGFLPFFKHVQERNIHTGIATNTTDQLLNLIVQKFDLTKFFGNHIYGISSVNNRAKPDPALFLFTAQQLKASPQSCIVIEDSRAGVDAAKAANMYCIGLNTNKDAHLLTAANIIVDHYDEINLDQLPR